MNVPASMPFTKLQALGNDFVLIDARTVPFEPTPDQVRRLADRHLGIGCDQLLILHAATDPNALCRVWIHNSDGSLAEQCGNGMRAVALWLHQAGALTHTARVETAGGLIEIAFVDPDRITASLDPPDFEPAAWGGQPGQADWPETIGSQTVRGHGVSMGNPHFVLRWPHPPSADEVLEAGRQFDRHPRLTKGANIGLAYRVDRQHLQLAVHERGAGPTLACGSGACAAAVVLMSAGEVDNPVSVQQPGGELVIHWLGAGQPVHMTGPARRVFDGTFQLDTFFSHDQAV
jgi:diaminopimelate epimerase